MKILLLTTCAALVLLGGIGCEMHPVRETVKADNAEKAEETASPTPAPGHH